MDHSGEISRANAMLESIVRQMDEVAEILYPIATTVAGRQLGAAAMAANSPKEFRQVILDIMERITPCDQRCPPRTLAEIYREKMRECYPEKLSSREPTTSPCERTL